MKLKHMMSMRAKTNWLFAAFLLFTIMFLVLINRYSVNTLKNSAADFNQQTLEDKTDYWDTRINTIGTYIVNMAYQERELLQTLMTVDDKDGLDYILAYNEIRKRFSDDLNYYNVMNAYFVYVGQNDDLIMSSTGSGNDYVEYKEEIVGCCSELGVWYTVKLGNSYHLIKSLNVGYSTYIGVILSLDDVASYFNGAYSEEECGIKIKDGSGNILYDSTENIKQSVDTIMSSKLKAVDFTIEEYIDESRIYKQIPSFSRAVLIYFSLSVVILMILYYILQYRAIQKPIDLLVKSVQNIQNGIMDARIEEQNSAEFNYLIKAYNDMLDKIYDLKLDIAETQLKEKYAKLKQLQAQINPHFFMNSLNLISSLSALQDYQTVSRLVYYLSEYFRFAVRNTEIATTIERELNHIKTCLNIHQIRFPNNLEYKFVVSPEVMDLKIPPLTIQPLTENAIIHGFKNEKDKIFCITVEIKRVNENVCITVSDNGTGFTQEKIEYIKRELGSSKELDHIGIQNVYLRLNMFFDGGVDMDFYNNEQGGASVVIKIPVRKMTEEGNPSV